LVDAVFTALSLAAVDFAAASFFTALVVASAFALLAAVSAFALLAAVSVFSFVAVSFGFASTAFVAATLLSKELSILLTMLLDIFENQSKD
jgi:hypothetical protein